MIFFKKKKKEENIQEIKDIIEGRETPKLPEEIEAEKIEEEEKPPETKVEVPEEEKPKEIEEKVEEPKKPMFAPLFVKINKYRSVLSSINDLKTTIIMIKNALAIQREIEGLRDENRKLLEAAINKLDKKIIALDSEFLRPRGLEEEFPPSTYETSELEGVVSDLKKQIEGLKSELKTIT